MKRRQYSRGRWQVHRERCRIEDWRPPPGEDRAMPLGSLVGRVMSRLGLDEAHWAAVLEDEWGALVGEGLARHTRPGPLQGARLVVYVDSPVWLNELRRIGRGPMLTNLQRRFGADKIADISLEIDPDG